MPKYCPECGTPTDESTKFCPSCGKSFEGAAAPSGIGVPAPGFSARVNDPEILAAVKKNRKAAGVFAFILVPIPIIGFVIYALASGAMEIGTALLIGGIISAVFLIFALYGLISSKAKKSYEAVVTEKKSCVTYGHKTGDTREMITEYRITAKTPDGKTKKIVEREGSPLIAWHYLEVGDRFKYHPNFNFRYELYDKSKAPYIACVSCGTKNPVIGDRCKKCGLPLLK